MPGTIQTAAYNATALISQRITNLVILTPLLYLRTRGYEVACIQMRVRRGLKPAAWMALSKRLTGNSRERVG